MTDNTKPSRLSALLKAPPPRQPIVIEGGGTKITVEIGEGLFEKPDRGYGEYVARRAMHIHSMKESGQIIMSMTLRLRVTSLSRRPST